MNSKEIINSQMKPPLLSGKSVAGKRAELIAYFKNTWQTYDGLFSLINNDEAYYLRPEPLRHPLIFYFGHTATFYINKLILGKFMTNRISEKLEAICAVGVDEMSWDDLDSTHYDWPTVEEVREYRQQVYKLILTLIEEMPLELPIAQNSLAWVILMGCEHERIHIETSSVIMRMLPLSNLTPSKQWLSCSDVGIAPKNILQKVSGKQLLLGKDKADETYGWDNEYGEVEVSVDDFNASKYLVSNQEFLVFIEAGGYQQLSYWTEEGQQWLSYKKSIMPVFWFKRDQQYFQRNLLNEIPLPLNWPAEVNYLEAKAFCNWKSEQEKRFIRLPTEAEWYCLRENTSRNYDSSQEVLANTNLAYYASSCPIDRFEQQGFFDVSGNVWQWSESAIDGFSGFEVHPLYDDFSTPTFDGKHNLIKGGSWISTGNETLKSARYAFRRHFYQHAGFRYIESEHQQPPVVKVNQYETNVQLCQQLNSHYGNVDSYPQQLAQQIKRVLKQYSIMNNKLLNLGCGVGRTAFELATVFSNIDAVDFSAGIIQYPVKLQQQGEIRYQTIIEGDIVAFNEQSLSKLSLNHFGKNINFCQGDAVNLKPIFTDYDVILLQQCLEKSYQPKKIISEIHQRLNQQGLLIVVSDFCFDPMLADKMHWLGGLKVNGENMSGFDGMSELLSKHFILLEQTTLIEKICLSRNKKVNTELSFSVWQLQSQG